MIKLHNCRYRKRMEVVLSIEYVVEDLTRAYQFIFPKEVIFDMKFKMIRI